MFICSRSGTVKIQEFSYNLREQDRANYLPKGAGSSPNSVYSLAITLWTAADYARPQEESPQFSEEFEKLLVLLSDQERRFSPRELLEREIPKEVLQNSSSVITQFLIDGVIDRALGRFGLNQNSIDKRPPLS